MRKTKYNIDKKWTLELIYERLLEEAEFNPSIFNLKQETAHTIRQITGCCNSKAFGLLKELENEYDFQTVGLKTMYGARNYINEVGIKSYPGVNNPLNKPYRAAIQYIFYCRTHEKPIEIQKWYEKYKATVKS